MLQQQRRTNSNTTPTATLQQQRYNNNSVASCSTIAVAALQVTMLPSLRPLSVRRPFDFCRTLIRRFVQALSSCALPSCACHPDMLTSYACHLDVLSSCALSSYVLFCHPTFSSNICLTSVQPLSDVR
jgi:hypothetical protein